MAGDVESLCAQALETSPPKTPPPRRRAERLARGLPAYINTWQRREHQKGTLEGQKAESEHCQDVVSVPDVNGPWRPSPRPQQRRPHAAPGAFMLPPEMLCYPLSRELVVGLAQDGLNRWASNISNEISHENRQIGEPLHIDSMDLPSMQHYVPSWSELAGRNESRMPSSPAVDADTAKSAGTAKKVVWRC
mmetsp:Transcript_45128/g.84217  ORF Transcript_45128/g.84217 Transcript_45128/m.84217 type:complete len:191 (+) Transcript_45128:62-634(+)